TLRFVRRVADVARVAAHEMVIGVQRAPFTAPAPEVAALDRSAGADAVQHCAVDELIEAVLERGRCARIEAAAVAGKSGLLDHQRLVEALGDRNLLGNIIARVSLGRWPRSRENLR